MLWVKSNRYLQIRKAQKVKVSTEDEVAKVKEEVSMMSTLKDALQVSEQAYPDQRGLVGPSRP